MIKRYYDYIKEDDNFKFESLEEEIRSMIEQTIENVGGDFKTLVDSIKKSPEDYKIEGLINDSDIYDFYLKWRNDIDELLSDINYFDEIPSENNVFSLYDFIIKGTERSVLEIVKNIK